jgi:dGTPase
VKTDGLHRTVCDYIAGMTDRYLLDEHARLFTPRVYANLGGRD